MQPIMNVRPWRPGIVILSFAVALAVLSGGHAARAQDLAVVPTHAFVLEAEPIVFERAPGAPSMANIISVGVVGSARLHVAWFEADADRLTVAFRVAGEEPAGFDRLRIGAGEGTRVVGTGPVTIAPALINVSGRIAVRYEHHAAGWGVIGAGVVTNESQEPLTLRRIDLVPHDAPAGLPVRVHERGEPRVAFEAWVDRLTASLLGLAGPLPPGTTPDAQLPGELVDLLNEGEADFRWLDPSAADLVLPPGASLFWALTPASFASDVRAARVLVAPRFVFEDGGGTCCETVPSAGTFAMTWVQ